jgi:hypothetical protein
LLGPTDHVVGWHKTHLRPLWMTAQEFAALPPTRTAREYHHRGSPPGVRTWIVTPGTRAEHHRVHESGGDHHAFFPVLISRTGAVARQDRLAAIRILQPRRSLG